MQTEKKLTGYPSIDKPWLKYYTEEEISTPLPTGTMYSHIFKKNQDNLNRIALNYYGSKISYQKFFENISEVASALEKLGVKPGDIVTVCMINSPETIYLIFALNKIGAVANMVYGGSTIAELKKYIVNSNSNIVFTLDMFQDKILEIVNDIPMKTVVVASMTQSMPNSQPCWISITKGRKAYSVPQGFSFHYLEAVFIKK